MGMGMTWVVDGDGGGGDAEGCAEGACGRNLAINCRRLPALGMAAADGGDWLGLRTESGVSWNASRASSSVTPLPFSGGRTNIAAPLPAPAAPP